MRTHIITIIHPSMWDRSWTTACLAMASRPKTTVKLNAFVGPSTYLKRGLEGVRGGQHGLGAAVCRMGIVGRGVVTSTKADFKNCVCQQRLNVFLMCIYPGPELSEGSALLPTEQKRHGGRMVLCGCIATPSLDLNQTSPCKKIMYKINE